MSYYTRYSLRIQPFNVPNISKDSPYAQFIPSVPHPRDIYEELAEELVPNEDAYYGLTNDEQSCWYGHEKDMAKFSRKYPNHLFILTGQGEERDDLWTKYFFNGRVQTERAKILFGDFDPSKLTEPREM